MKLLNKLVGKINETLYNAVVERNLTELCIQTDSVRSKIISYYTLDNQPELQKMIEQYQKWVDAAATIFESKEENIAYQMGLLGGTVATVALLLEQQKQLKGYEVTHLETKYQDEIIEQLMENDYVQHNQLAKNLGISSSQLTSIMSRVDGEQQNVVSMSRVGKFKYYCLTDMGRRYYSNQHKGNFREEILELLKSVLDRGKLTKQNTIKKFVDRYYMNDIELKQKAMEVEYFLDSLEKQSGRGAASQFGIGKGGYLSVKRMVAAQVASNVGTSVMYVGNLPHGYGQMGEEFAVQESAWYPITRIMDEAYEGDGKEIRVLV